MTGPGTDPLLEAVEVMARIRREGEWESAQTHTSLLPYLVEESWELVDAVCSGDRDDLVAELGDLLLQVLFHSAIGAERATEPFDLRDVAASLLAKLRRRAPYWFDAAGAGGISAQEQDRLWQEAKLRERGDAPARGVLEGIVWAQPALSLGQKVVERVLGAGLPEDLLPEELTVVPVTPGGVAGGSGSVEVDYRQAVTDFAARVRSAEVWLLRSRPGPVPWDADRWRAAWPAGATSAGQPVEHGEPDGAARPGDQQ